METLRRLKSYLIEIWVAIYVEKLKSLQDLQKGAKVCNFSTEFVNNQAVIFALQVNMLKPCPGQLSSVREKNGCYLAEHLSSADTWLHFWDVSKLIDLKPMLPWIFGVRLFIAATTKRFALKAASSFSAFLSVMRVHSQPSNEAL